MISQIFLNKSINRIHKKIQNSCLFLRAMKYTYLYIKLFYIKYNVLLKYRHINEIIVFAFQMKMLYQINQFFKLQPFLVKKKTVRKKAESHSNTNKCTIKVKQHQLQQTYFRHFIHCPCFNLLKKNTCQSFIGILVAEI